MLECIILKGVLVNLLPRFVLHLGMGVGGVKGGS